MPNRILRDGILTSEPVASLSWAAEVFYRRLMSVADDHGRFHGIPKLIRAACYPLQIDKVSDADIGKWLTECVTAALVSVYPAADGKRYIQIEKFGQQVRARSKFPEPIGVNEQHAPAPDINCYQLLANAHLVGDVVEDDKEIGATGVPPAAPTRKPSVPVQAVVDAYNSTMTRLSKVRSMTTKRKRAIERLWLDSPLAGDVELFRQYFEECDGDPFLGGVGPYREPHENWRPDFDYLTRVDVVTKVYEKAMDAIDRETRQ